MLGNPNWSAPHRGAGYPPPVVDINAKLKTGQGGGTSYRDATEMADRKREADGAAAENQEGLPSGLWPTRGIHNTPGATLI